MAGENVNVLGTRATREQYEAVSSEIPEAEYNELLSNVSNLEGQIESITGSITEANIEDCDAITG